jgi:GNAT superfamily N-acetyltransferase
MVRTTRMRYLVSGVRKAHQKRKAQCVGCVAVQPLEHRIEEIKRMYVRPERRRRGLSRVLLASAEELARERGMTSLRETGYKLDEALGLYTSSGYQRIPLYGDYLGSTYSVCFEKSL